MNSDVFTITKLGFDRLRCRGLGEVFPLTIRMLCSSGLQVFVEDPRRPGEWALVSGVRLAADGRGAGTEAYELDLKLI